MGHLGSKLETRWSKAFIRTDLPSDMMAQCAIPVRARGQRLTVPRAARGDAEGFAIPDPKWGETPVAARVLREPGAAS